MRLSKSRWGLLFLHRLSFCRYTAVRLSGRVQQTRQLLQPAPDTLPHAAAVSALDPGNLRHPHAQVKPRVNTPGLDGGQLHQRGIHFLPQLLLLTTIQTRRIYARFYLGMTVAEIARIEGADRRRVWESIRRGLKKLARLLDTAR